MQPLSFFTGLPQMHSEVSAETLRPDPIIFHLVTWPLRPHPRVGQIHAFAGQPDPQALMNGFSKIWVRMLHNGLIRAPSSAANYTNVDTDSFGNAFAAENEDDNYDDEYGFYAGRGRGSGKGKGKSGGKGKGGRGGGKGKGGGRVIPFDEKTRCYQCGGLGHIFRFTRDGVTYVCPTQTQISRTILDAIIYPHITAGTSAAHEANADDDGANDDYNGPEDEATAAVAAVEYFNWWE